MDCLLNLTVQCSMLQHVMLNLELKGLFNVTTLDVNSGIKGTVQCYNTWC